MRENVSEKSFRFAQRIVRLYQYLITKNEYVMSKQLLRSGTSIGANIAEGNKPKAVLILFRSSVLR